MSEPAATGDVASPTPVGTTGAAGAGGGAGAGGQAATAASRRAGFFGDNAAAATVLTGGAVATGTTGVRTGHTTKPLVEDKTPKEFDIPFAITEDEARGLRLLKAQVEAARGVTMPTDLRLLQFLLGRKMDVPSALKKLTKYQEVERQWALESCGLWADDTIKELQTLKMYVVPPTAGAPAVLYFHAALHLPDDFTTECTMRSFCHLIWRMLENPNTIRNGFSMVYLMDGFAWKNFDLNAEKIFLDTFQDRIPLRYHAMIAVQAPWYFRAILKMVKPFMKQKLRDRMVMASTSADLVKHLPREAIPTRFGGLNKYDPQEWVDGEIRYLQEAKRRHRAMSGGHRHSQGRA